MNGGKIGLRFLSIVFCILVGVLIFSATAVACIHFSKNFLSGDNRREIFIDTEIEVYIGQTARLTPSLVDSDGTIYDAVFDYSTESTVLALDSTDPGKFTAMSYADDPQVITITEKSSGAGAEVKVTIISNELSEIVGTELDSDSVLLGQALTLSVRTLPAHCDFSDYYSVEIYNLSGTTVTDAFSVTDGDGVISLMARGLGSGMIKVSFSNPDRGLNYTAEYSFSITLPDSAIADAVLAAAAEGGLAGQSALGSVTQIELASSTADLSCLEQIPSVEKVILSAESVFSPQGELPLDITYYVSSDIAERYYESPDWATVSENIYPEDGADGTICTVYHSTLGKKFYYELGAQTPIEYEPEVDGYTFMGWYSAPSGGDRVTSVTSPCHLYARWSANEYEIIFNTFSSPETMTMPAVYGEVVGDMPVPERMGYTFAGWYSQENGGGTLYENGFTYLFSDNLKLYAFWTANTYRVTLDYQGGGDDTQFEVTFSGTIGDKLPTSAEKAGNVFGGWYTEAGGEGLLYTPESTVDFAQDITLYAKWTATITFDYQLGGGENMPVAVEVVYNNLVPALPEPVRSGYEFDGWYTLVGGGGEQIAEGGKYIRGEGVTLYAKWVTDITFVVGEGFHIAIPSKQVTYNAPVGTLPVPVSDAEFAFDGWYLSQAFDSRVTGDTLYVQDGPVSLYPRWNIRIYLDYQGATSGNEESFVYALQNEYIGADVLPTPVRTGYCFSGWYTGPEGNGELYTAQTYVSGENAVRLYAYWRIETYLLTFDLNYEDGGTAATQTLQYGKTFTLPAEPSRAGYVFTGWYLDPSDEGTMLTGGTVSDLGDYESGYSEQPIAINVYARWDLETADYYGDGTADSPYEIYNVYQLADLSAQVNGGNNFSGSYFMIMNDINNVGEWNPIGDNNNDTYYSTADEAVARRFAGVFDGGGHTISGYTVSADSETYTDTYVGLFGYIASGGTVKNLKVSEMQIDGHSKRESGSKGGGHYGAIAGINSGVISYCNVLSGTVSGSAVLDTHVGGVAGYMFLSGSVISNCTNAAAISGTAGRCVSHGGIVGSVNNGVIFECENSAAVTGTNNNTGSYSNGQKGYMFMGGIAGVSCAVVVKCTNNGSVYGGSWAYDTVSNAGSGSIVGYLHNGSDVSTDSTGDETLEIVKGDGYYSALVSCSSTTGEKPIGFLQNDSGNGKKPVAVTDGIMGEWKAKSGSDPESVNESDYAEYLSSAGVVNTMFATGLLVIPSDCIITGEINNFEANTQWTFGITDLPDDAYGYIILAVSVFAGFVGAAIILIALFVKRRKDKRKGVSTEEINEKSGT